MSGSVVVQCSENEVKPRMAVAFKPGKTLIDLYGEELEPGTAELLTGRVR